MNATTARTLTLVAALSFLPAVAFYYVGEEAIFPIISLEMWQQHEWIRQRLFGLNPQHNPLFNWLIMPLAALAGWQYVLEITRAITIAATLATAGVVGWLVWRLLRDGAPAWFAALVYLTLADVLLYRGWLAYVDPLFGLFVFGAIATLWVACAENRPRLFAVAALSLTCAFLSKAFTAYVFYGSALFVVLFYAQYRRVLLGLPSLIWHAVALAAPLLWLGIFPANTGQGGRMFFEMLDKLIPAGFFEYLRKLCVFPAETLLRLSPAAPLAAWFAWRGRLVFGGPLRRHALTAAAIAGLCYLPYWLAPASAIRYLMPIYPLAAVALALIIWSAGQQALQQARRWLTAMLVLKFAAALVLFPYYQSHYRGENYLQTAAEIVKISSGHTLYTASDTASGLSVAGYIDAKWRPADPLLWMPAEWQDGFVIAESADPAIGATTARFKLGGDELFLLCRGAACAAGR
jgi:4-amino-4-deoxy-L-arabinose transferase-like glycosyltransferase